jgi:hypothetical protein
VDQGKGSARSLQLAGLTCRWLLISGFSPTPLVRLGLRFRIIVAASSGRADRVTRAGWAPYGSSGFPGAGHHPYSAQARYAQIFKRNQEARGDAGRTSIRSASDVVGGQIA